MSKGPMSPQFLTVFALLLVGSSANNIQPKQYTLELLIDTEKDVFSGNLIIDAVVLQGGALNFVLHNSGLNISTVNVNQQGIGNTYQSMQTNADSQFTMISVYREMASDRNVQISIAYEGRVTHDGAGLFSFWDNGKKFYMTNFYPIYARRVFPCIDEPGVAAQMALNIILTKSNGTLIASTGMLQEKTLPNGYKMYALSTTVPIAPYSLFFTVGDWSDDVYYPPSPSKVWLPPSLKGMANNIDTNLIGALRNSKISFFLHAFTQQLNIFIVPHLKDETYTGLNTLVLRNDIVIKNPQETTKTMERDHLVKFAFASWKLFYGTAMRPTDWGNNWLSTSVPMYLAYKILDEPEFTPLYGNSDENLVTGLYEKVFATSLASDSPVTYLAMSPTQPEDIVSFVQSSGVEKGVYSLKTIESVVKPDMLSSALFAFFTQYNNSSVDTALLIDFIGKSTNPVILSKTLSDVMMPILSQTGYPLISLSRNGGTIDMLKQSFAAGSNKPFKSPRLTGANSWELPVTVSTSMNPSRENISVFFFKAGPSNNLVEIGSGYPQNGWALLNLDGKGMMRTSYDLLSWNLFAANANSTNTFSPATRAKLVADAFAAAESQTNHWLNTIKFLEMLDSENHTAPWMNALAGFKRMWSWIYSTGENVGQINLVQPFKTYVMARLSNIYQKLGPIGHNGEANDYLRREIVAAMCEYGSNECISNLTAQYDKMFHKEFEPSNNLFSVVVCNGLRNAKADDWTSALNMFVFSGSWFPQQVLNSHYSFLACSNSDEIINSFLTTILLSTNNVSFPQNQIVPAVTEILDKPQHVTKVVRFFVDNQPKFNFSSETQAEIVTEIGKRVTTSSQTDMLKAFQSKYNVTSDVAAALSKAISRGTDMTALIQKIAPIVQAALASENPTTTSTGPSSSTGTTSSAPTVSTSTVPPPPSTTPGAASATAVSIGALLATLAVAFCAQ